MKILALEPYYGGSHKAFLDGWISRSRHDWTLLTLPPRKWKWRMRHSAITFAGQLDKIREKEKGWNLIFCSDMLDLAGFLGLTARRSLPVPAAAYFHENQLTYPVLHAKEYDYHFAFSNLTTALAAREVWFNSAFHRDSFLSALPKFLRRMPDHRPLAEIEIIREKSRVRYPPIESFPARPPREPGPLRILWAARWEYDKRPDIFFRALEILAERGADFRLSVIGGGRGKKCDPIFCRLKEKFADRIIHWGWRKDKSDYRTVLLTSDVAVSTADHEFFGIGMAEAAAAGVYPLVPARLAYPEVLGPSSGEGRDDFFYQGGAKELACRLEELIERFAKDNLWQGEPDRGRKRVKRFYWEKLVPIMDDDLDHLAETHSETVE